MPQGKSRTDPDDVVLADEVSKPQPGDLAHARIVLTSDDETPTVALIADRLWDVRQLYALFFLLRTPIHDDTDFLEMALLRLESVEKSDLEDLVPIKLELRAAGLGSLWVDLYNVAKDSPKTWPVISATATASLMLVALLFRQGRDLFWRDATAATQIKEADRDVKVAAAAAKVAQSDKDRVTAEAGKQLAPFSVVVEKLKEIESLKQTTSEQRELLQRYLFELVDDVFGKNSAEKMRTLPPPAQQTLPPEPSEPTRK